MSLYGGAQRASRHSSRLRHALAAAILLIGAIGAAAAPAPAAAGSPAKVAIIVGPVGSQTAHYRAAADAAAAEARRYTSNVIRIYSPNATWSRVKAAITGATLVIYLGHGNGFPSPYGTKLRTSVQDGFGLNPRLHGNNSTTKYYGEAYVRTVRLAPHAVVILNHLCYASGNSEPGGTPPTLSVARRRVDNFGAGFLRAGASVVIAEGVSPITSYIRAIFTSTMTLDEAWRAAPSFHDNVRTFASTRTPGATLRLDPVSPTTGYYRSIVGWLSTPATRVGRSGSDPASSAAVPRVDAAAASPGTAARLGLASPSGGPTTPTAGVGAVPRREAPLHHPL